MPEKHEGQEEPFPVVMSYWEARQWLGEEAGVEKAPERERESPRVAFAFSNAGPFEWTGLAASHTAWHLVVAAQPGCRGSEAVEMRAWSQGQPVSSVT